MKPYGIISKMTEADAVILDPFLIGEKANG